MIGICTGNLRNNSLLERYRCANLRARSSSIVVLPWLLHCYALFPRDRSVFEDNCYCYWQREAPQCADGPKCAKDVKCCDECILALIFIYVWLVINESRGDAKRCGCDSCELLSHDMPRTTDKTHAKYFSLNKILRFSQHWLWRVLYSAT
jgi:hypothetical protein